MAHINSCTTRCIWYVVYHHITVLLGMYSFDVHNNMGFHIKIPQIIQESGGGDWLTALHRFKLISHPLRNAGPKEAS